MAFFKTTAGELRDAGRAVEKASDALKEAQARRTQATANVTALKEQIESARQSAAADAIAGKEPSDYTALQIQLQHLINVEAAYAAAVEEAGRKLEAAGALQKQAQIAHQKQLVRDALADLDRALSAFDGVNSRLPELGASPDLWFPELSAERLTAWRRAADAYRNPPQNKAPAGIVSLRLLRRHNSLNAGEIAGFPKSQAARLLALDAAELVSPSDANSDLNAEIERARREIETERQRATPEADAAAVVSGSGMWNFGRAWYGE